MIKDLELDRLDWITYVKTALKYYSLVKGLTSGSRARDNGDITRPRLNTRICSSCELIEDKPEKLLSGRLSWLKQGEILVKKNYLYEGKTFHFFMRR